MIVNDIKPGSDVAMEVMPAGGKPVRIFVLTREQALHLAKARLGGRDRLVLSPGDVYFENNHVHVTAREASRLAVATFPALARPGAGFRDAGRDGIFQRYESTGKFPETDLVVEIKPIAEAAPSQPAKINPNPRRHVVLEPDDADFDRRPHQRGPHVAADLV